jgi:hypothetical protein
LGVTTELCLIVRSKVPEISHIRVSFLALNGLIQVEASNLAKFNGLMFNTFLVVVTL